MADTDDVKLHVVERLGVCVTDALPDTLDVGVVRCDGDELNVVVSDAEIDADTLLVTAWLNV